MPVQTTYPILPAFCVPGQLADSNLEGQVIEGRFAAAGSIPFGALVELVSGKVQVMQQTSSTISGLLGVAIYQGMREQAYPPGSVAINAGYVAGDMVPVLRRGRIFALWEGTTLTAMAQPNITHSSTAANGQGTLTDASTSTGAGTEVTAAPEGVRLGPDQAGLPSNCALLEINLPA